MRFFIKICLLLFVLGAIDTKLATQVISLQQDLDSLYAIPKNSYPIRMGYVDKLYEYWPPQKLAAGMAVPGFADEKIYNYIVLGFWGCYTNPVDAARAWEKADDYFGTDFIGGTKDQIQKNLKKKYNDANSKIMIGAFGPLEKPTKQGYSATQCATKLANFVIQNNFDGCDIDWEDSSMMQLGYGQQWLIDFTKALRKIIPNYIITHSPQASYFKSEYYRNGGYTTIDKAVGNQINFYSIRFYNQGDSKYNTYDELFLNSTGKYSNTSVRQIMGRGVAANKIIIGKPVTPSDANNTGYVDMILMGEYNSKAYSDFHWYGGVMLWQYSSDVGGRAMKLAAGYIKQQCSISKDCK